jgi:hypothetical protein
MEHREVVIYAEPVGFKRQHVRRAAVTLKWARTRHLSFNFAFM